jgi:hypothetical protein
VGDLARGSRPDNIDEPEDPGPTSPDPASREAAASETEYEDDDGWETL